MKKILILFFCLLFQVNIVCAKEIICGSLCSFVYDPNAQPKEGCLYEYNPQWFPLKVIQPLSGGILVSGNYSYGTSLGLKNIYIQTSKSFVSNQWMTEPEIVKFMGTYDYVNVLGAKQRVWKFYRYGKYEIEQKVDMSYFQIKNKVQVKPKQNLTVDEAIAMMEKDIINGKYKDVFSFYDLLVNDLEVSHKPESDSLYGDILNLKNQIENKNDEKSIINKKYIKQIIKSVEFIETRELPCGRNKIVINEPDKKLLEPEVYSYLLILNKALDYCDI